MGRAAYRERAQPAPAQVIDQFLDEHRSSGVTTLIMTVFDAGGVGAPSGRRYWTPPTCRVHNGARAISMSFGEAVVGSSKPAGTPASYPIEPILRRAREWLLRGMKSSSRRQGRTSVVGFESGPWLQMIGDVGF